MRANTGGRTSEKNTKCEDVTFFAARERFTLLQSENASRP